MAPQSHMLPTFLNCAGLMPKGLCSSLSSLALRRGNISPPQVGAQRTRLYLQRASSQHTIRMQTHAHRCTMEYTHTRQRSFVAPVPLQICFFLSVIPEAVLLSCEDLGREGGMKSEQHKRERSLCSCVSVRRVSRAPQYVGITSYFVFYSSRYGEYVR